MKRYFNTTGYCRADWHYIINPLRGKENEIYPLIENKQYFLIHAPRQTGKTTLLHALAKKINEEGRYICVAFSIENAGYPGIAVEKAMMLIIRSLYENAVNTLLPEAYPNPPNDYKPIEDLLFKYLTDWSRKQPKRIVLLIDEIDSIWDDVLIAVLRQLRNGFQYRPKAFPVSVALVGLRDIRDYKMKIREMDGVLGSGSPFNIKAESFRLGSFTKEQIAALYQQHTDDTGQVFSNEVIDLVYDYTGGQPWLVNALANEIVTKILKNDYTAEITTEIVDIAKENLIQRRDTHLDSLMDKLKEDRVKNIVQGVISGGITDSDTYNDDLLYTIDLGIVADVDSGIQISNKIYTEIIPRILNKRWQDGLKPVVSPQWFIKNNQLDMNALLRQFQKFYRRHSESWLDKFSYQEAGKQLLLMAFLQRIINSGGKIDREMVYGCGRTDLTIEYGNDTFILELKLNYGDYIREEGLEQLSDYLDKAGLMHGYLIIFEIKSSKELPWEKRITWEDVDFEWNGVKRKITIVGM